MSYVPLKITFRMETPVALGFPWISFDGLVLHILLRESLGEKYYYLPTKTPIKYVIKKLDSSKIQDPPLKRWRDLYVASVSIINGEPFIFHYFKRGDFKFTSGKIRRGSGFFKDFYLKITYVPVREVVFYATGDPRELVRILSKVKALGKDRNIGFGFVKEVRVEEVDYEAGLVWNGKCMRPIPVEYLREYGDAAYLAYRPPYWDKRNIKLCGVPFTKCVLK